MIKRSLAFSVVTKVSVNITFYTSPIIFVSFLSLFHPFFPIPSFYTYSIILYPYSIILYPYSIIFYPYSIILYPYSIIFYPYSIILYPYSIILYSYSILLYPYSIIFYPPLSSFCFLFHRAFCILLYHFVFSSIFLYSLPSFCIYYFVFSSIFVSCSIILYLEFCIFQYFCVLFHNFVFRILYFPVFLYPLPSFCI